MATTSQDFIAFYCTSSNRSKFTLYRKNNGATAFSSTSPNYSSNIAEYSFNSSSSATRQFVIVPTSGTLNRTAYYDDGTLKSSASACNALISSGTLQYGTDWTWGNFEVSDGYGGTETLSGLVSPVFNVGASTTDITSTKVFNLDDLSLWYEETTVTISITANTTNCTVSPESFTQGESVTITATPTNTTDYEFSTAPTATDGSNTYVFTINSDGTATLTISDTSNINSLTVTATATEKVKNVNITSGLTACTLVYSPENPVQGQDITFTLTADENYEFTSSNIPTYTYTSAYGGSGEFTISDDGQTATATVGGSLTTSENITAISVVGVATLKQTIPTASTGFITLYKISDDELKSLSQVRYTYADGTSPANIVDLGEYILSLKRFYCDIPTSTSGNIILAKIDTGVSCNIASDFTTTVDCGNVTISGENSNINDYTNTDITVMLPFIGLSTLQTDDVIGHTINIKYDISLITGDAVCTITDTDNNCVINTYNCSVCEDIPYILNNIQWQIKGSTDFNSTQLYGFIPIVYVKYHANYNDNSTILLSDNKYSLLSDLSGLNYIDDVVIEDSNIDDDTKNLIYSTLNNGVIF